MSSKPQPWKRSSERRRIRYRMPREKILIVCEGEQTEPNYFKSFPVNKDVVEVDIHGEGKNTDSLVEEAIRLKNRAEKNGSPYNQIWCVFDRDDFPKQNFYRALQLAVNSKIRVAYSNQAFEIWYLLHFHYVVEAAERSEYQARLSRLLGHRYEKNSQTIYRELLDKQEKAITHARKLLEEYHSQDIEAQNPSTKVHLLVEELNKRLLL